MSLLSPPSLGLPPSLPSSTPPDFFLLLDLEITTDDMNDPLRSEIIDFPWLTLCTSNLTPLDHKQIYITPHHNQNPNPPPDALPQSPNVLFSPSLSHALSLFHAYIYHSFILPQRSFMLVFDGHWDLTHVLFPEAFRKGITLASYFAKFINLRAEFRTCYPDSPARDRNGMCQYLSIPRPTRASGIQECSTLAHLLTTILSHPQHVLSPVSLPLPAPLAPSLASALPVGGIVRLRGLPYMAGVKDIDAFLDGIQIVPGGVHFVKNAQGRNSGEAFVQLSTQKGVEDALKRNRQGMGKRYIEVFKSSPGDMANFLGRVDARRQLRDGHNAQRKNARRNARARDNSQPHHNHNNNNNNGSSRDRTVVRVSNLPHDAVVDDVLKLFNDLEISSERVVLHTNSAATREAFIKLNGATTLDKALAKSGSSVTSHSDVTSIVQIEKTAPTSAAGFESPDGKKRAHALNGEVRYFMRIVNLDDSTPPNAILEHFSHLHVQEDDLKVSKPYPSERVVRVSFRSRELRDDALTTDCRALGVDVVLEDGGMDVPRKYHHHHHHHHQGSGSPRVVRMRGLPYTSNEDDIVQFFNGYRIAPGGITRGKDRHGRASGEAWVRFVSADDAREVVSKLDKAHMGSRYIELKF